MTVNELLSALKLESLPTAHLSNSLLAAVKNCDQRINSVFFSAEPYVSDLKYAEPYRAKLKEFAVKLICYTISKNPDYSFSNSVRQMDDRILTDWFANNNVDIGNAFMLNLMEARLGKTLDTSPEFVAEFAGQLMQDEYIAGFIFEAATMPTTLTGKMTLLTLKQIDTKQVWLSQVIAKWQQHPLYQKYYADYASYPWLDCVNGKFLGEQDAFNIIKGFTKDSCSRKTTQIRTVRDVIDITPSGAPIMGNVNHDFDIYGANVAAWLKDVASTYNLTTDKRPQNEFDRGQHTSGGGCVLGNTRILMADGTEKEIQAVEPGDLIFSVGGGISVTSCEKIVNSHVARFYSINDDAPFMSPEHPILTQNGWKCVNPQAAIEISPRLEVSMLSIGDIVCKVKGYNYATRTIEYENVRVEHINLAEPNEVGYDLHFAEGYKSYHANKYCCMLNYPDITAHSVRQNLFGTNDEHQIRMLKNRVDEITPTLEQMFGETVVAQAKNMLERPVLNVEPARNPYTTRNLTDKNFLYSTIVFDDTPLLKSYLQNQSAGAAAIERINIIQGNVYLCGDEEEFADQVNFSPQEDTVFFTKGNSLYYMKFLHNGLMAKGAVLEAGQIRTFTALSNIRYPLKYKKDPASDEWTSFAWLRMWFEKNASGSYAPVAGLFLSEKDTATLDQSVADKCVFSLVKSGNQTVLGVDITIGQMAYDFLKSANIFFFLKLNLHFTLDYKDLSGIGERPEEKNTYPITAQYEEYNELATLETKLANYLAAKKPVAENWHSSRPLFLSREANLLQNASGLSVEDLYSVTKPENIKDVHDMNFNKVKNMMLYAIPEDWRTMIQQPKPTVGLYGDITEAERDLAINDPEIKNFLIDSFGKGYFTTALSKTTDSVIANKFNKFDNYQQKLDYYWKGIDDSKCFSKQKAYSRITNASYLNSYLSFVPRLRYYKDDDAKGWAKKLYDYVVLSPVILQGLAFETQAAQDKSHLHHITTMLDILDNGQNVELSGGAQQQTSYSNALYYKVMCYILGNSCGSVNSIAIDGLTKNDMQEIIENYFRQYYLAIMEGESFHGVNWSDELRQELRKELDEYMKDYAQKTVDVYITSLSNFIIQFANILINAKELNIQAFRTFANQYPKITNCLSYALSLVYYSMSAIAIYYAITAGKSFSDIDWAKFAIGNAGVIAYAFNSFAVYKAAKTLLNLNSSVPQIMQALREIGNANNSIEVIAMGVNEAGGLEIALTQAGVNLSQEMIANGGELLKTAARWAQVAKVAGAVLKTVTVVALGAALAFSIYQTVLDFQKGESTAIEVLEVIETVTVGITFLVEAGTGIAALVGATVCSAIPIIGCAIMFIGLIVMIVLAFLPRKQEPTLAEKYVDNQCKSFLDGLNVPSNDWLKKQQEIVNHLENVTNAPSILFA